MVRKSILNTFIRLFIPIINHFESEIQPIIIILNITADKSTKIILIIPRIIVLLSHNEPIFKYNPAIIVLCSHKPERNSTEEEDRAANPARGQLHASTLSQC
jgi:hypothetical protein